MAWKVLEEEVLLERAPYFRVKQERVQTDKNQVIDDFYQIEMRSFAMIVPVLADGRVMMVRQYRHGARQKALCFPGGFIEEGEQPEQAARRELLEETGLASDKFVSLGSFVDNGNQRCSVGHYFLAPECEVVGPPEPEELEDFTYETLTFEDITAALVRGEIMLAHTALAWGLTLARGEGTGS